jgi:hypothetical protein
MLTGFFRLQDKGIIDIQIRWHNITSHNSLHTYLCDIIWIYQLKFNEFALGNGVSGAWVKEAGRQHFAQFDATGLASGVYLYRFVTDSGSLIRKMVLNEVAPL